MCTRIYNSSCFALFILDHIFLFFDWTLIDFNFWLLRSVIWNSCWQLSFLWFLCFLHVLLCRFLCLYIYVFHSLNWQTKHRLSESFWHLFSINRASRKANFWLGLFLNRGNLCRLTSRLRTIALLLVVSTLTGSVAWEEKQEDHAMYYENYEASAHSLACISILDK